jgi:hypothetical protein
MGVVVNWECLHVAACEHSQKPPCKTLSSD